MLRIISRLYIFEAQHPCLRLDKGDERRPGGHLVACFADDLRLNPRQGDDLPAVEGSQRAEAVGIEGCLAHQGSFDTIRSAFQRGSHFGLPWASVILRDNPKPYRRL